MDMESGMDKEEMGMRNLIDFNKIHPPQTKIIKALFLSLKGSNIIK